MIGKLIDLCARHRWLVILLYVAVAFVSVRAARQVPLDAIPDLSEPQVIVFTEWKGRSPTLVEDQITYPLSSTLLAAPHVSAVRGFSMFGMSFVHVIFDEGTDLYWARSRVLEYLATSSGKLPAGVAPSLGPDASGVGWVYEYALVDHTGKHDLGELRALQDYNLRFALESVPGVSQVASVGGYERQFQVTLDPDKLRAQSLTIDDVAQVVRRSSDEVGGRLLELSGREYFIRGRGFVTDAASIGQTLVKTGAGGVAIRVADVATVQMGPDVRRGAAEIDGRGETVGAIVMSRQGANARDVIGRVRSRVDELRASLPEGVEIVTTYDRSALIDRAGKTLARSLFEEGVTVAAVILMFLLHVRSAVLPIVSMPLAVLMSLALMWVAGIPATIMSLGGIAIAIGATVDAEIVMIEACHKKLEHAPADITPRERAKLLGEAAKEVTPAIFFSLLIVAASFVPVFGLNGQAGRMFHPLAFTKTAVMLSAAVLSVTLAPALRNLLLRGDIYHEAQHPISRAIRAVYEPFVHVALRKPRTTLAIGGFAILSAVPLFLKLGNEFMPSLDEGDLLFMPTTLPNVSIEEAKRQLQRQDALLRVQPEVRSVFGKIGRAETPTDPAPLSMVETVIQLNPPETWPMRKRTRWYSSWAPGWLKSPLGWMWPELTHETRDELITRLDATLQLAGWTNAWTMPIRARIDMLTTGVRTPVGIKVFGTDLAQIESTGAQIEQQLRSVAGTRSVLFERSQGGSYVDIVPRRDALARHGVQMDEVLAMINGAVGGEPVATTLRGRQRIGINVRWKQDFRSSPEDLRALPVPISIGATPDAGRTTSAPTTSLRPTVPLGDLADIVVSEGPPMLRSEAGLLVGYVYVDLEPWRDQSGYVADAARKLDGARASGDLKLAQGTFMRWTGQYELLEQMRSRMKLLIPAALLLIALLLYFQFGNLTEVAIVFLSIPFALVGSVWLLYLLDYRLSTAVWVGVIALTGLAAQTGVVMIVYIDQAFTRRVREGKLDSLDDIIAAHAEGTIQRVRPKLMTVSTMLIGLLPLLWAEGSGADVMKRIAAPMVGGLLSSAFLTLELIPVVYTYWRAAQLAYAKKHGVPIAEVCGVQNATAALNSSS